MPWYAVLTFLGLGGAGQYYLFKSTRNLSDEPNARTRIRWLGIFAGRKCYSDVGWRYFITAVLLHLAAIILGALLAVIGTLVTA